VRAVPRPLGRFAAFRFPTCLLLTFLLSAPAAPAQPALPAGAQPAGIAIASVRVTGWENLPEVAADPVPWVRLLLEDWAEGRRTWVELTDARPAGSGAGSSPGPAAAAELEVEITAAGFRTRVALTPPSGRKLESRASLQGHRGAALLSALAGDLFFLWAQAGGFALQPARPAPPLGSMLSLDSLRLLPGWRLEASEPLDCAASPRGPVLLFSDRLLGLDRDLDISMATAQDLLLRPPFPAGFRPDRLWLDPLRRPLLFSAATGETLSYAGQPERRETGLRQPVHAAALPQGGLAVLVSGRITRALRRDGAVQREQLPLPGSFYAAVEGSDGELWVLDMVERRVRILNEQGEEVRSLKPALDPARLPFPQVFLPVADGGLLLGGAGGLWRFDRRGAPVWRLEGVFTGVREALPAFFRVAAVEDSGLTLYLLDPLGRRLFRFDDAVPGPASVLSALLARRERGEASGGELAQYALDRGLPLLARTFLQAAMPDTSAEARLARVAKARLLQGLVRVADEAEAQLRLPDTEAALREAARIAGELRAVDPVEPSYARDQTAIVARRARLREELLEPGEQGLEAALEAAEAGRPILSLGNTSTFPAEAVSVQLRWAGFPPGAGVEWMQPIRSGYTVRLPLPFPPKLEGYEEELTLCLSVLASWRQEGQRERRFLQAAYALPPR